MRSLTSRYLIPALLALASLSTTSLAYELPPDPVDLQAAYCLGLYKLNPPTAAGLEWMQTQPPHERARYVEQRATQAANDRKVRGYLAGRLQYIDVTGLLIASKQAELDMNQSLSALAACAEACVDRSCASKCRGPQAISEKMTRCTTLDFMPY